MILPAVQSVLIKLLGPERVRQIHRPGIWMWPQAVHALACLIATVVFAILGWRLSRTSGVVRK